MHYHHQAASGPPARKKRSTAQAKPEEGWDEQIMPALTTTAGIEPTHRQIHPSQKLAPRSTYRYQLMADFLQEADTIAMPDGVLYRRGNEQIYAHHGPPPAPLRASRTTHQEAAIRPRSMEPQASSPRHPHRRFHWLFWAGVLLAAMIAGYAALGAFGAWWQIHTNDGTYGRPRTYQADAVVGHGDAPGHPSHFMAVNLKRHIIVVEIPGGDISRSVIYSGPVLLGDGQDLTPVTLSFADVNGDGRPDMLLHILDQTLVFVNNGTKFVPPSGLAGGGSNPPAPGVYHAAGDDPHPSRLL